MSIERPQEESVENIPRVGDILGSQRARDRRQEGAISSLLVAYIMLGHLVATPLH